MRIGYLEELKTSLDSNISMNKPNFFIVGAPKAGTTSLYHYLDQHPDVFMSEIKETNFFSIEEIKSQGLFYNEEKIKSLDQYLNLFKDVSNQKAIGEASVSYLFYNSIPTKIYKFNPESRIIILLRNPVNRGFSHFLMDSRLGLVSGNYEDIISKKDMTRMGKLHYQQYVELGLYHDQVKRYINTFGNNRVHIIFFEELKSDIENIVRRVFNFLSVSDEFQPVLDITHNPYKEPKNNFYKYFYKQRTFRKVLSKTLPLSIKDRIFEKSAKPILSKATHDKLIDIYSEDISKLENLLNVDLQTWYE